MGKGFFTQLTANFRAHGASQAFFEAENMKLYGPWHNFIFAISVKRHMSKCMGFPTIWYVLPAKAPTSLRIRPD